MRSLPSKKKKIIQFAVVSILLCISLVFIMNGLRLNPESQNGGLKYSGEDQILSKNNFSPVVTSEKYGLGNISVSNIFYNESGYTTSPLFSQLDDDIDDGALNITYLGTHFIKTTQIAESNNRGEVFNVTTIKLLLNDTLKVSFDKSKVSSFNGYLIYHSQLNPMNVKEIYVNGTKLKEGDYYFIDQKYIKFFYYDYFDQIPSGNFTMTIRWEYQINVNNWQVYQIGNQNLFITKKQQTIEPEYNYQFNLVGKRYGTSLLSTSVNSKEINVDLKVNLPDKELLQNHKLRINQRDISDSEFQSYLNPNKSIDISLLTNNTLFSVNFTAQFEVKFVKPLFKTFGIDRLYNGNDIRERVYFPTIVSGPAHLLVKYVSFLDLDIWYDEVVSTYSQYNRQFSYIDANDSIHTDVTKGIEITLPYLIKGEVCPISIRYKANQNLRIIVRDNINTPVYNVKVRLLYYGREFGTFVSRNWTQPTSPLITDQNGEIILKNVPRGNYSLDVLYNNKIIKTQTVDTTINPNIVPTNIPHFPLIFLIFISISGIIFASGAIVYIFNKRRNR
ncbi:MAG: hypothetical protein P8Y70_11245 [Candidatus Lokiarchaeota archaeon]